MSTAIDLSFWKFFSGIVLDYERTQKDLVVEYNTLKAATGNTTKAI
ncbi:hypothetical protein ACQKII_22975 [Lysinibacillus sp. NPDC048646]